MKKICFFNTVPFWGGGEKFYLEYATRFSKRGYEVEVVCSPDSVLGKRAREAGIPTFEISIGMLSFLNPLKVFRLIRYFKQKGTQVVIFSTSQDLKAGGFSSKWAGVTKRVFRRGLAKPIKDRWLNRIIFTKVLTHIFANSEETKRTILQHLSHCIPAEKIEVIYNGIDPKAFPLDTPIMEVVERKKKGVVIGNAARLTAQKGQNYLLEVASILKSRSLDFSLFIAGSGEMKEELEEEIQRLGLQKEVHLLGFVEDINTFMGSIDVFALSSIWEGFGYVLAEAMIRSKPVVAFDITSNPEIFNHGEQGFLVEFPNVEDFADRLEELIVDQKMREEMGVSGRQRVLTHFDIERQTDKLEAYLKS